jgi:hypothetical protein
MVPRLRKGEGRAQGRRSSRKEAKLEVESGIQGVNVSHEDEIDKAKFFSNAQ